MIKRELLKRLDEIATNGDIESAHIDADDALIEYIGDKDIERAYLKIRKWYA